MAKITIDFGCDFVREYTTTDDIDQKLRQGEILKLEAMHPRHAEHMKISTVGILPPQNFTATDIINASLNHLGDNKKAPGIDPLSCRGDDMKLQEFDGTMASVVMFNTTAADPINRVVRYETLINGVIADWNIEYDPSTLQTAEVRNHNEEALREFMRIRFDLPKQKEVTIPFLFAKFLVDHLHEEGHKFMAEDLIKYMGDSND